MSLPPARSLVPVTLLWGLEVKHAEVLSITILGTHPGDT